MVSYMSKQEGVFRSVKHYREVQQDKDVKATTSLGSYELTDDPHKCSFNEMTMKSWDRLSLKCIPWKISPTGCFCAIVLWSNKFVIMLHIIPPLEESQQAYVYTSFWQVIIKQFVGITLCWNSRFPKFLWPWHGTYHMIKNLLTVLEIWSPMEHTLETDYGGKTKQNSVMVVGNS